MIAESEALARALSQARATSGLIPAPGWAPDLPAAYAIQSRVFAERGAPVAGWKLALTNVRGQKHMGVDHPTVGRLAQSDCMPSPAVVELGPAQTYAEAELLFVMGADLPPRERPYAPGEIAEAVAALHAGIELCASRYVDDEVEVGALIADNSFADRLIVGERLATGWDPVFASLVVRLDRDGRPSAYGDTDAVMGDPLAALAWLANWLSAQGEGLRRGQIVASGSCTGMTPIEGGELLRARFADVGEAVVRTASKQYNGGPHEH